MGLQPISIGPGVVKDDTQYASQGWVVDSDQMRIVRGVFETMGGWETACPGQSIIGPIRGNHAWADDNGTPYAAMGSWAKLYVQQGDSIYDITPLVADGSLTNALSTVLGSNVVTVDQTAHGLTVGTTVHLEASAPVGGIQIGASGVEAANSFGTAANSAIVNVNHTAHGRVNGDIAGWTGSTPFNGVNVDGEYTIAVVDPDNFQFQASTTATATGFGGGTPAYVYSDSFMITSTPDANHYTIVADIPATATAAAGGGTLAYEYELAPGLIDGTGPGGYGSGTYGSGVYGRGPDPENLGQWNPRTWCLDNYGGDLIGNPLSGTIYIWTPNLSQRAIALANAPAQVNACLVTNEKLIVALGCNSADTGIFDPLLERWSGAINDPTVWMPAIGNLASNNYITTGSRLLGGKRTTNGFLAWTDVSCHYNQYTSDDTGLYQPLLVGSGCGLIGPLAVVEKDGKAYWMTPQGGYYDYNGSSAGEMPSGCRNFVSNSLDRTQQFKVVCTYDAEWNGVEWRYPNNATEVNAYIRLDLNSVSSSSSTVSDPRAGWSIGTSVFSDKCDRSVYPNPIGYGLDNTVYWAESGLSADGAPIDRKLETAWFDIPGVDGGVGENVMNINRFVPDFLMTGLLYYTALAKKWPQMKDTDPDVVVKGPMTIAPTTLNQRFRIQGRQIKYLFEMNGIADSCRFGTLRVDTSMGPRR
jgi:hypothetical protein